MKLPDYLQPLQASDYPRLVELWQAAGWIDVRPTDTAQVYARFLERNPSGNYGAYAGSRLVGAVLAGHDGWRGYLYHMAIAPEHRERDIGAQLVKAALAALQREGIAKVHCLVKRDNLIARQFWEACGFELRDDLYDYSLR